MRATNGPDPITNTVIVIRKAKSFRFEITGRHGCAVACTATPIVKTQPTTTSCTALALPRSHWAKGDAKLWDEEEEGIIIHLCCERAKYKFVAFKLHGTRFLDFGPRRRPRNKILGPGSNSKRFLIQNHYEQLDFWSWAQIPGFWTLAETQKQDFGVWV